MLAGWPTLSDYICFGHRLYGCCTQQVYFCNWQGLKTTRPSVHIKLLEYWEFEDNANNCVVNNLNYCLTKISIWAKRSISRVFSLFIVPSPFFVHCLYKGHINRAESVLTGLKPY